MESLKLRLYVPPPSKDPRRLSRLQHRWEGTHWKTLEQMGITEEALNKMYVPRLFRLRLRMERRLHVFLGLIRLRKKTWKGIPVEVIRRRTECQFEIGDRAKELQRIHAMDVTVRMKMSDDDLDNELEKRDGLETTQQDGVTAKKLGKAVMTYPEEVKWVFEHFNTIVTKTPGMDCAEINEARLKESPSPGCITLIRAYADDLRAFIKDVCNGVLKATATDIVEPTNVDGERVYKDTPGRIQWMKDQLANRAEQLERTG